ncbi:MAG: hypothetical protein JSV04_14180 [Candidatus Heimdallarchaeota archaeon]|nr:MAG: hypothetical protein JSV04_14180 [Candidatus Heimdallarchaeota archaeon]
MRLVEIQEGLGTFFVPPPKGDDSIPRRSDEVFFNFHQEINRDFSVLMLRAYARKNSKASLTVCEPLCGSGVRSIRYALETPTSSVYSNDINPKAIMVAEKNIKRLSKEIAQKIQLFNMECNSFLQSLNNTDEIFDFVDIDPYGTPIPFVHNSIRLVNLHGLLAFTATDLASLVGLYPKALYAKYGVSQFDSGIGNIHEIAARVLITGIQHVGLTLGQSLIPIVTFYHRHYIRCFLSRERGVDRVVDQTGFIFKCGNCQTRYKRILGEKDTTCPVCNGNKGMKVGPLYLGKIHQIDYLSLMLSDEHLQHVGTRKRLSKVLPLMIEEGSLDLPWSFDIPQLAKKTGVQVSSIKQIATILHEMGYICHKTHFSGTSLKTNASETEVCSVLRSLRTV